MAALRGNPDGAKADLIDGSTRFETPGTSGVVAWCLDPHDPWVSKAIAGRPKDVEFCRALIRKEMVKPNTLRTRLQAGQRT